jgi:hypothetical protein
MRTVILLLSLAIAGYSTPYQPMGFGGGVEAQQMTADTYRIRAKGNGRTASSTIMDYLLVKSAETTKAAGGPMGDMVFSSGGGSIDQVVRRVATCTSGCLRCRPDSPRQPTPWPRMI